MVLDIFYIRFFSRSFLFAAFLILILVCPLAFSQTWTNSGSSCNLTYITTNCQSKNSPWRIQSTPNHPTCSGASIHVCQINSSPCVSPQVWNQMTFICDSPPPPDCSHLAGSSWDGEGCSCPSGMTPGLTGGVSGGLSEACINENPPEEGCPEGSYQVQIGEDDLCWSPPPENECPEGSYMVNYNGLEQCWTPDPGSENCPEGTYYYEVNGVGQCFNPNANSSSSSSSSTSTSTSSGGVGSSSSSGGGGGDGSSSGGGTGDGEGESGTEFDDSNIVGALNQLKNKADSTNSKLDDANETLTGIKDILEGEGGDTMPGHSEGSHPSFAAVNAAFYSRISTTQISQAFSGVSNLVSLSSAECPVLEIEFPEPISITASTSIHCDTYASAALVFQIVMSAVWLFAAFRIFASA